ncbi:MAG: sodium:proton antiporter [Moraxellaceae bacterium]|jgi:Kef-type K+ transport system membrane component KefB|nr:sodium:proton antiporter [Moraxellaceae bacterium]MDF3030671.1 sodium:proton antiporter [Moraxellaceae bacterium]
MESLSFAFFLIFAGAAVLATLALYSRQPLLMAYIVLGMLIGPYGFKLVTDVAALQQMASVGIMFLLFLLGLDLQPSALLAVMRQASWVTVLSSLVFFAIGYAVPALFGFTGHECLVIGFALVNSSTIIGLKLLPTTVLHHRHMGELMVGLLLLQDFIALFILIALSAMAEGSTDSMMLLQVLAGLPVLVGGAWLFVKYVLVRLYARFDRFQEYLFLMTIGWCLGVAEIAHLLGLSGETGAFIAGITLASHPVSQYLALQLRPLRDFFLILFFFALGASFDSGLLPEIWLPSLILTGLVVAVKPLVFRLLLGRFSEDPKLAWDVGFRLGQISEFSLLISFMAVALGIIGREAAHVIEATAILTFVISSYIVVFNYPNPIAVSEHLRRD